MCGEENTSQPANVRVVRLRRTASALQSGSPPLCQKSSTFLTVLLHFKQQHPARHEREPRPLAPAEGELFRAHDAEGVDGGGRGKLRDEDHRHGKRRAELTHANHIRNIPF